MMKNILIAVLGFMFQYAANAQFNPVVIAGSQIRNIHSDIVNQDYELHISLPSSYTKTNKLYPVVYLMDSQWDFPLVTALYGEQYYDGFVPEIIVVGVSWGGTHPNYDSLRARDYTPTKENRLPQSGGADNFLSFMKTELFPFIESNYRADKKDRTLMGCSLGGLITLYSLFTQPDLFQRYVAASPAFGWDNNVIYQYEKKYFENSAKPKARLFMCMGGVERSVPGFDQLVQHLSSRRYPSLSIETKVLENIGHSGTKGEGYARGLQFAFARPSLKIADDVLKKYTGVYSFPNGNNVEIKSENQTLVIYPGSRNKYIMKAASETDFYSTAEFLNIHFKKDDNGNITGFQLEQYGSNVFITKIK